MLGWKIWIEIICKVLHQGMPAWFNHGLARERQVRVRDPECCTVERAAADTQVKLCQQLPCIEAFR